MFSKVIFKPDDSPSRRAQFPTRRFEDGDGFAQPCPHFKVDRCTIYADRPSLCRTYRCRTLTELEDGEIEGAEALKRVGIALETRERLLSGAGGHSLGEVREWAKESGPLPHEKGESVIFLGALAVLLDRWFRYDDEKQRGDVA